MPSEYPSEGISMSMKNFMRFALRWARLPAILLAGVLTLRLTPLLAAEAPAATQIPPALQGTWRVTGVLVDTVTIRRLNIEYDDPNYIGGILLIAPDALLGAIESWGGVCLEPTVTVKPTTADALIKDTMGGRAYAPDRTAPELSRLPPATPTPQDYLLPYTDKTPVEPMRIHCGKGRIGGWDHSIGHGTWMLVLPDGKLGIRWVDSSVLVLSRVAEQLKPVASFDCAKARTPVEKTICDSMELALLDRTDVRSFANLIDIFKRRARLDHEPRYLDAAKDLKGVYRAWRKRRDTCGTDAACLKKSLLEMRDILENTEIPNFYTPESK
jgi:hypothetical protein